MDRREIQDHNKVNKDRVNPQEWYEFLNGADFRGYGEANLYVTDIKSKSKYMLAIYCSNGTIIQCFFSNRNRLANKVKQIQKMYDNIKCRIIVEVINHG